MALFISTFLVLLIGAHYFVYVTVVHFFAVTTLSHKYAVAFFLALLSVSFILSSTVAHLYENFFTRSAYFLSGFWLGLLVNLIVASVLLWGTVWVFQGTTFLPSRALLGTVFFGMAFLVSGYGVWQALHPVVTKATVTLSNLPETWRGQTLVQISDVHLGHVYQAGFLKQVVSTVNALHPKVVVITGDLFDGMDGQLDSLVAPLNDIEATEGIYFVTGNHETYLGVENAFRVLRSTKVTILNDEVRDVDGVRLVGIGYPLRGEKKDLVATLDSLKTQFLGRPTVLLYHAPESITEVATRGVTLMLSGHTHQGQQFPFQFITALVHKGFDYGLYTIGDFHLYTTSGVGTWGPTMRVGTKSEIVALTLQ